MTTTRPYVITLTGCDDTTTIPMELTAVEYALVSRLAGLSYDISASSCMPVMDIGEDPR